MARKKFQPQYIKSDTARKSTLKKRKEGLIKKMHELSTLCDIESCIVIHSPKCPEPDMWPSRSKTEKVIQRYKNMPAFEKSKKMEDQSSLAQQELAKAQEQLAKIQKENTIKELNVMVSNSMSNNRGWIVSLDSNYLNFMSNHVLERELEQMESRIAMLNLKPNILLQE